MARRFYKTKSMNLFVNGVKTSVPDKAKKLLQEKFPNAFKKPGDPGYRPVTFRTTNLFTSIDPETKQQRRSLVRNVANTNEVRWTKDGVSEDTSKGEISIIVLAQDITRYSQPELKPSYTPISHDVQGTLSLDSSELEKLYFFAFVSGEIEGNYCPKEHQHLHKIVKLDQPALEAKLLYARQEKIDKAIHVVMSSKFNQEKYLQIAQKLGVSEVMAMEEEEIRIAIRLKVLEDTEGVTAEFVIEQLAEEKEVDKDADKVYKLIDSKKIWFEKEKGVWMYQKKDGAQAVLLENAQELSKPEDLIGQYKKNEYTKKFIDSI